MQVRFSRPKGTPVLTCVRADGSSTYSKSAHGAFFGPHDLMHFAVETTLGMRGAFFGLIAAGWTIEQFSEPGAAARLPAEALLAEHIVNLLMQEVTYGPVRDAKGFNSVLAEAMAGGKHGGSAAARSLAEDELREIRERFAELLGRFQTLAPGESLDLEFP